MWMVNTAVMQAAEQAVRKVMDQHVVVSKGNISPSNPTGIRTVPPSAPPEANLTKKSVPPYLQTDPSALDRAKHIAKEALVDHESVLQQESERVIFDDRIRRETQDHFRATKPWTPTDFDWTDHRYTANHVPPNEIVQRNFIHAVWELLRNALGYTVWDLQDLYRYLGKWRDGGWNWLDLTQDVGFLWRIGVTALLLGGVTQVVTWTEMGARLWSDLWSLWTHTLRFLTTWDRPLQGNDRIASQMGVSMYGTASAPPPPSVMDRFTVPT